MLVDGMTAANDLGLTDAVPARVTIHTDARRRSIQLDNLFIEFKLTAPSRLYWAGRPAIRDDLVDGFAALSAWMRALLRELPGFEPAGGWRSVPAARPPAGTAAAKRRQARRGTEVPR